MLAIAIKLYFDLFYKLNYISINTIFSQVHIQYIKGKYLKISHKVFVILLYDKMMNYVLSLCIFKFLKLFLKLYID